MISNKTSKVTSYGSHTPLSRRGEEEVGIALHGKSLCKEEYKIVFNIIYYSTKNREHSGTLKIA